MCGLSQMFFIKQCLSIVSFGEESVASFACERESERKQERDWRDVRGKWNTGTRPGSKWPNSYSSISCHISCNQRIMVIESDWSGSALMHNKTKCRAGEQGDRSHKAPTVWWSANPNVDEWMVKKDDPPSEMLPWLLGQYQSFREPISSWKALRFIIMWCHNAPHHWTLWLVEEKSFLDNRIGCGLLVTVRPVQKWRQNPACLLFVDWWESCSASCVSMEEAPWKGPKSTPRPNPSQYSQAPRWAAVSGVKSRSLTSRRQQLQQSIIKLEGNGWWAITAHFPCLLFHYFSLKVASFFRKV